MESSTDPNLTPRVLSRISEVLRVPVAQLLGQADHQENRVNRRQLLKAAGATAALGVSEPGRVGSAELAQIEHGISTLRAVDQRMGADPLRFFAERLVGDTQRLLQGRYSSQTALHLHRLLGEASVLAGWLAQDADDPVAATRYYGEAVAAATLAEAPLVTAHACANLALLAAMSGQPSRALQCARAGQRAAVEGRGGPRLRSLLFAREVTGHAALGDVRACEEAERRALRAFESEDGHDPEWVLFLSDTELAGILGDASSRLGRHRKALQDLTTAAEMGGRPRNAVAWQLVQAKGFAAAGDPAQAAGIASAALPEVLELHSGRLRQRVGELARSLSPQRAVAEVADFIARAREAGLVA